MRAVLAFVLASITALPAMAAGAKINITSPAEGARLDAKAQSAFVYEIALEGEGDHAHLYVDDKQVALLRQMKGSHMLEPLSRGVHEICVRTVNKDHAPTGVESCVNVIVE